MTDKRTITSKVEKLENQCGEKPFIVVLCDTTKTPMLYEIPSEKNRFKNEAEYQEWRKKLGPDVELYLVEIYLNKPKACASEVTRKKEES